MTENPLLTEISALLNEQAGISAAVTGFQPVAGGDASSAYRVQLADGSRLFCKYSPASDSRERRRFRVESLALTRLAAESDFVIPQPLACSDQWLVLQWLDLQRGDSRWQHDFGRALATLHSNSASRRFGFAEDNWLGGSVQCNNWHQDWLQFWLSCRYQPQLQVLQDALDRDDALLRALHSLERVIEELLSLPVRAVLLHGDLWSGNVAADTQGRPVMFDPASYYGHHEAEFGMLRLFGSFSQDFEAAYREILPFAAGHERRISLYRLYHELNHLILFGASYYPAALQTARSLL